MLPVDDAFTHEAIANGRIERRQHAPPVGNRRLAAARSDHQSTEEQPIGPRARIGELVVQPDGELGRKLGRRVHAIGDVLARRVAARVAHELGAHGGAHGAERLRPIEPEAAQQHRAVAVQPVVELGPMRGRPGGECVRGGVEPVAGLEQQRQGRAFDCISRLHVAKCIGSRRRGAHATTPRPTSNGCSYDRHTMRGYRG